VRNAVALQITRAIAQKPTSDIHVGSGWIIQLDRILQRWVGVRENFVNNDTGNRQVIRVTGRGRSREIDNVRRTIRQTTLRHAIGLDAEIHYVNQVGDQIVETKSFAGAIQAEI